MKRLIAFLLAFAFVCVPAFSATITTAQNGNWSDTATWNGGSVPAEGDEAQISHTITLDDAAGIDPGDGSRLVIVGDDSGDGVLIQSGGKLQYTSSQTKNMLLRVKGNLNVATGGEFEVGTVANPITATIFTCETNYSATLADGEFDFIVDGVLELQGKPLTYWRTETNGAITAGDKSFTTADSTGWVVGDRVVVVATESDGQSESFLITGISGTTIYIDSNGDGSGASPVFAYNHDSVARVGNLTRNIIIQPYNTTYEADYDFKGTNVDIDWVAFIDTGRNAYLNYGIVLGDGCAIGYSSFYAPNVAGTSALTFSGSYGDIYIDSCFIYEHDRGIINRDVAGRGTTVKDCVTVAVSDMSDDITWTVFDDCEWADGSSNTGMLSSLVKVEFKGGRAWCYRCFIRPDSDDDAVFYDFDFSYQYGDTINGVIYGYSQNAWNFVLNNCRSDDWWDYYDPRDGGWVKIIDYNQTSGSNVIRYKYGYVESGVYASVTARGGSGNCLVFNPHNSTSLQQNVWYRFEIPVTSGQAFNLTYYAKLSAADANGSLHLSVDVEGCGIEDLDNEASSLSESDWNQETISVSAPSRDGLVRVTINVWDTDGTALDVYVDDIEVSAGGNANTGELDIWGEFYTPVFDATGTGSGSGLIGRSAIEGGFE